MPGSCFLVFLLAQVQLVIRFWNSTMSQEGSVPWLKCNRWSNFGTLQCQYFGTLQCRSTGIVEFQNLITCYAWAKVLIPVVDDLAGTSAALICQACDIYNKRSPLWMIKSGTPAASTRLVWFKYLQSSKQWRFKVKASAVLGCQIQSGTRLHNLTWLLYIYISTISLYREFMIASIELEAHEVLLVLDGCLLAQWVLSLGLAVLRTCSAGKLATAPPKGDSFPNSLMQAPRFDSSACMRPVNRPLNSQDVISFGNLRCNPAGCHWTFSSICSLLVVL